MATPPRDILLTGDDRFELMSGISAAFRRPENAERLLMMIGFPAMRMPNFNLNMTRAWNEVFTDLENGILPPAPYRTILLAALRVYSDHPVLRPLAKRYGLAPAGRPRAVADPVAQSADGDSTLHNASVHGGDTLRVDAPSDPEKRGSVSLDPPVGVHVFAASPSDRVLLRASAELRAIQTVARYRNITVTLSTATNLLDLQEVLTTRPRILHLSTHGESGCLVFEDALGEAVLVQANDLVGLLSTYRERAGLRLNGLVLNSCDSAAIAEQFRGVADVVVAHRGQLDDECAIAFVQNLYETLSQVPDLASAAWIAAEQVSRAIGSCARTVTNLVVLSGAGAR